MEYKTTYTLEEIKELYSWFDSHEYPSELTLEHGIVIKDTKLLIEKTRSIAMKKYDNTTFSGQINLLFQVREKMIDMGF